MSDIETTAGADVPANETTVDETAVEASETVNVEAVEEPTPRPCPRRRRPHRPKQRLKLPPPCRPSLSAT